MLSNENKDKFRNERKLVWQLHDDGKYEECIKKCDKNIREILENGLTIEHREDIRSFLYMKAKCCKHLGKIKEAVLMINNSLKYSGIELYKIHTYWLLAECKVKLDLIDDAIDLYNKCIEYYNNQLVFAEDDQCLIGLVSLYSNKSVLLDDVELSKYALDTYLEKHKEELNNDFINELYENMFKIYVKKDEIINAQKIIRKINRTNKDLGKKLFKNIDNKALVAIE